MDSTRVDYQEGRLTSPVTKLMRVLDRPRTLAALCDLTGDPLSIVLRNIELARAEGFGIKANWDPTIGHVSRWVEPEFQATTTYTREVY